MKQHARTALELTLGLAVMAATPAEGIEPPVSLRQDAESTIGSIGVACTGIAGSKDDPRWLAYPLRIEFANDRREHLIGAQVTVSTMEHQQVMNVSCWGAWLLLKPPGQDSYRIEAKIIGETVPAQSTTVRAPANGQTRVVLEFPGVGA